MQLTRKNLMVKNLKRYRKYLEREVSKVEASKCDFFPMTFELPVSVFLRGEGLGLPRHPLCTHKQKTHKMTYSRIFHPHRMEQSIM